MVKKRNHELAESVANKALALRDAEDKVTAYKEELGIKDIKTDLKDLVERLQKAEREPSRGINDFDEKSKKKKILTNEEATDKAIKELEKEEKKKKAKDKKKK